MPLSPGEGCWLAATGRLEVQARGVLARLEVLAREEVLGFDNRLVEVLEAKAAK